MFITKIIDSKTSRKDFLKLGVLAAGALANCMVDPLHPTKSVGKDRTAIISLLGGTSINSVYGYAVAHKNQTLSDLAIVYAGTPNAEIVALNDSTPWTNKDNQWTAVAKDNAGNVVKTIETGVIDATGRIWSGYNTKLTNLGFSAAEAGRVASIQFYIFDKNTLNNPRTMWARQPNDEIKANAKPEGIVTHSPQSDPYILLADALSDMTLANVNNGKAGYRISARDGSHITSVRKKVGNGWETMQLSEFVTNAAGFPDAINRTNSNVPYKQFVLTPSTMLQILFGQPEYEVTFDGRTTKNFKFDTKAINQQLSKEPGNLYKHPAVAVGSATVSNFPLNEWPGVGTLTWRMVNGVPRFEFVAAPAGGKTTYTSSTGASVTVSNLKLKDSDIIAIGADDFGDPTNDPYSQLPINYVPFSLGAGVRDNNYLAFDHPNGARGFVVGRQSVDGVTSNYFDFSNLTETQLNPNGGLGLTIYLYDAVTGLNSTFRIVTANVGLLSDDPTTPVVEAKVPLLNDPYVPNQDLDQPNAQQVRSKPSTLLNTAQKDQQEKNRARTQEKRDLAKTTRTLLDDSYPNP